MAPKSTNESGSITTRSRDSQQYDQLVIHERDNKYIRKNSTYDTVYCSCTLMCGFAGKAALFVDNSALSDDKRACHNESLRHNFRSFLHYLFRRNARMHLALYS